MAVKPISPSEVVKRREASLPDGVIKAFNDLIAKHWNGYSANFTLDAAAKAVAHEMGCTTQHCFAEHWLDVENVFAKHGWVVVFDKPGYCESYAANYTFRKKA